MVKSGWNRLREGLRNPAAGAWLAVLVALAVLLPAWWMAGRWYERRLIAERQSQAADEVALRAVALSAALNRRFSLLDGLNAFSQVVIQDENFGKSFETFAASVYASTTGIRTIAVAPGGIVYYVYPIEDNVRVVGYDPLKDTRPGVREDVERAIGTRQIVLSGPTDLADGGMGVVARKAVFQNERYWGLINLVVDLEPVLALAGIGDEAGTLDLVLSDQAGQLFYGAKEVLLEEPVVQRINLPDGAWVLAGVPAGGWKAAVSEDLLLFRVGLLTIAMMVAGMVYLTANRQARLAGAVRQRTQEITQVNEALEQDIIERQKAEAALREREAQYRGIFESVSDGLFINTLEGELVDFNPAAARMHGYTVEEFRSLQPRDFIHPDSWGIFEKYVEAVRAGGQFRGRARDVYKDGTPFQVEITGTQFSYYGRTHTLAAVRDITEQVEAYQLLEQRVAERTREIAALLELARNVASTLELTPLLALILSQLQTVVDYTGAAIATIEDGSFTFLDYRGPSEREQVLGLRVAVKAPSGYRQVIQKRQPVIFNELDVPEADKGTDGAVLEAFNGAFDYAHAWLGVPLMVKDRLIGVLHVDRVRPGHFDDQDAQLVLAFANQAAVAIENARLYERAQSAAALEERQRLARELHDSVSQALYGIALGTRTARAMVDKSEVGKPELASPLEYVLSLADAGLAEMRALIFELRPESLESEGLVAALSKLAEAMRARHQIEVQTDLGEEPSIALRMKESLYRVAQEALHNTTKHAHATQVKLKLALDERALTLEIADNGTGFDTLQEYPGHLGLRSMRERIEALGGKFKIESAPQAGTHILATVPLEGKA